MNAAEKIVLQCLGMKKDERFLIITDEETQTIAEEIYAVAKTVNPTGVKLFLMEDYGQRPEKPTPEQPSLALPQDIIAGLEESEISLYVAQTKPGELHTFRQPLLSIIQKEKEHLRHGHMPGITQELLEKGLAIDYDYLHTICTTLYDKVHTAQKITVTTPAGTNITVTFHPDYTWRICDGLLHKAGDWSNLPDGEVFTCPLSVDGNIVADGVLGDYFDKKYGLLDRHPLHLTVKKNTVETVTCENKNIEEDFSEYIRQDENSSLFGEFAIGCNVGITQLFGNMLIDEKYPGIHLAVGDPYSEETGAPWKSKAHCDMVLRKTTISVDGHVIMKDGVFIEEILKK